MDPQWQHQTDEDLMLRFQKGEALAFEELVAHQLGLRRLRRQQKRAQAPVLSGDRSLRARLLEGLPFELTAAQSRVMGEIDADLRRPHPMLRLLQGDVGSGKTVVAALAALLLGAISRRSRKEAA